MIQQKAEFHLLKGVETQPEKIQSTRLKKKTSSGLCAGGLVLGSLAFLLETVTEAGKFVMVG